MRNGREEVVESDEIVVDDIVIAKPGEKIAADGVIIIGESSVDESMITGESVPIDKKVGDEVIGGTINKNGYVRFKATSVGNHTVLANIIEMVKSARMSKAPIQRIADRAVQYFIPIVPFYRPCFFTLLDSCSTSIHSVCYNSVCYNSCCLMSVCFRNSYSNGNIFRD